MEIKAELNYLRISPRKVRSIATLVRGMNVKRAELELNHTYRAAAAPVLKLLHSAIAAAKKDFRVEKTDGLYIKKIFVDEGPKLKRYRARAFGRAASIRKRSSNVSLVLDVKESK